MTAPADLIVTGEVYALDGDGSASEPTAEAVAVRDGRIVRVDSAYEVGFLEGVGTEVIDLGGALLPGFIDAHTHLPMVGRRLVHADLSVAGGPAEAVDLLREGARADREWILGYGYDESAWTESRYLTRGDLDRVSSERPVAVFREDMHAASLNSVAIDRLADDLPREDVRRERGDPTGVVVESAVDPVFAATEPGVAETRDLVRAARDRAHERGITGVHDMVRNSHAPRIYRELDAADDLDLRVRLNYWSDHLDSLVDVGVRTNHGSDLVRAGGIKSYTDGSIGAGTAKLSAPYEERGDGEDDGASGQWVVAPDDLRELVARADEEGLQFAAHAIGDEAIAAVLDAYAATDDPGERRHRVEHAELLSEAAIERFADLGAVASVQPNFLKWSREGGLYEERLGRERARSTNRYRDLLDAGVPLAFGSDCMPMDPLFGVQQAITAPTERQRLTVTEALRAYTRGAAYAGFDEDRLGTIAVGKRADLVALDASPWAVEADAVGDIGVTHTVVDGRIVYRRDG